MSEPTCSWDHVTKANPDGDKCGKEAKWMVNAPRGYWVCGIHKRSALAIGDDDITARDKVHEKMCGLWLGPRGRCRNVVAYDTPFGTMCTKCSLKRANGILKEHEHLLWALKRTGQLR